MFIKRLIGLFILISFCAAGFTQEETDQTLRLEIGDPLYKSKTLNIEAGKIFSAEKGKAIAFKEMIDAMKKARFIYVGETHDSLPMHEIQFKIAKALYMQNRNLSIGLEMFDVNWQEKLNQWSMGIMTEDEFIDLAKWYENWNFNFDYYRKIFELAKEHKIPMYALNSPREIIRKIRMRGWESLSEEEKNIVPEPGLSNEDHRFFMKKIFSEVNMPEAMKGHEQMMFEGLYRAQSAWDEVMAKNTLKAADVEGSRVIVFAGSGHLLYNLGISRRVFEKRAFPFKTVICITVPEGKESIEVSRSIADFVWGIPFEKRPVYPSPGIALKKVEGLDNPIIESDPVSGAARGQNFKKGDIILSVDGKEYVSINDLRKYLSRFGWGDEVCFRMLREAVEIETMLVFKEQREN